MLFFFLKVIYAHHRCLFLLSRLSSPGNFTRCAIKQDHRHLVALCSYCASLCFNLVSFLISFSPISSTFTLCALVLSAAYLLPSIADGDQEQCNQSMAPETTIETVGRVLEYNDADTAITTVSALTNCSLSNYIIQYIQQRRRRKEEILIKDVAHVGEIGLKESKRGKKRKIFFRTKLLTLVCTLRSAV